MNNTAGITGITGYTWNLGASNNGWIYNGFQAPQNIQTTANTLNLSPICGAIQNNVSATVVYNSSNYITNASTISYIQPVLNVQGSSTICSGSSSYFINYLPCDANVIWTTSVPGIISISTVGNTATATKIGDGSTLLTGTITGGCANGTSASLLLGVGVLSQPGAINFIAGICAEYQVSVSPLPAATSYTWSFYKQPYVNNLQSFPNSGATKKLNINQGSGTYNIGVTAENACGSSPIRFGTRSINCGNNLFIISPNPASSTLKVTTISSVEVPDKLSDINLNSKSTTPVTGNFFKANKRDYSSISKNVTKEKTIMVSPATIIKGIRILDVNGRIIKNLNYGFGLKQVVIAVDFLNPGIYFLDIFDGKTVTSEQIIIHR